MKEEVWLVYLKDHRPDLYKQAKEYIAKQTSVLDKAKQDLQESEVVVERYRNLISSNYIFDIK